MCPRVLNPFWTFLLEHISVPSSISQRSGTQHIENSSNSFKTNCFYSKKHYKTIVEKCRNVVVNVWSSLHRRDGCVSRSPVGELTSSRVASVPTVTGTAYGFFFLNLYKLFHLSTSSSCTQLSHDPPPAPISQRVQLVPSASQSVRWDCCRGSEGDEGFGSRSASLLFLLLRRLAHCDEAAAFGGVRRGGAAVFEDAESLV